VESRVPLAIVGNGGAAAEAVLALRACGYDGDIHMFSENRRPPYNPTLGSYLLSGALKEDQVFPFGDERTFYGANRVDAHLARRVVALDAVDQRLTVDDGSSYRYDRCLVASGAHPAVPPVTGLAEALAASLDVRRVFALRTLDDALHLKAAVERLRGEGGRTVRAAVLGASFVGVKVAAALHDLGLEVCFIEREPIILPLSAHTKCAKVMQEHLLQMGFDLRLGAALTGVEVGESGVRLHFGGADCLVAEEFDIVAVCAGTRPSLSFLDPRQVDIGGGIMVDEQMRSSVPTLYAAGDVAEGKNLLTGRHEVIGLWASARHQGRAAGRSLAGIASGYPGNVPHNITHVGKTVFASIGCLKEYDQQTVCESRNELQIRVWQEGRLVGVNLLNCCEGAGAVRQALLKAASGVTDSTEATWTNFSD